MITRIRRHAHSLTPLSALYGEGGEQVAPRLIAGAWDRAGLHPWRYGNPDAQHLAAWLDEPLAQLPSNRPARTAWLCTVFADPEDRSLTGQQWAQVATAIMHGTGLAPHGDARGVRWVAATHGADHIHILATLARQDGTAPPSGRNVPAARKACHAAEDSLGLRSTRQMDTTTLRHRLSATAIQCPAVSAIAHQNRGPR